MKQAKEVDWNSFGDELWNIADIFRSDIVKPTEYLEEFSYLFFLRLFDEQELYYESIAKELGEEYTPVIPQEYRFFNWACDPRNYARRMGFNNVIDFLDKMFQDLANLPDTENSKIDEDRRIIRKIFSNKTRKIQNDNTAIQVIDRLRVLKLPKDESKRFDALGRGYEFLMYKLGQQGNYGQYFTPRNIVAFMVRLIDPNPGEVIFDPAAGTGGFLVKAFEYVKQKIDSRINYAEKEIKLRELKHNLYGIEKAPDVFKLGLMNLRLHGDGSSNFENDDTLSGKVQSANKEKADIILTNPPFGPFAGEPTGSFKYTFKRFETYFLQAIMDFVKPGGRVATVMMEGVLFNDNYKELRRDLVEKFKLEAVFSLNPWVFEPYSNAKTDILVFKKPKKDGEKTTKVLFFDIKEDGYIGTQARRPVGNCGKNGDIDECGDLPLALEI
ncbi:type I restriction-modification system subunit M [Sulfuracidifex metallicus]|uniref:type I restriction-modification system subunit M n=1 Tax=Sulfuracidifex metallicus TaxID=47303 RepID=UPI0022741C4C|nr:class I SAM-dependent DNA methyltransferase [Sulfuracidifex metallicus]MCY0850179.1 class I SAM-dependent DNA methyltransferase [Sulfuracidifex metallicus]